MNRASLPVLTWVTVFAALTSAVLLTATDGSLVDAEALKGALDTLIEAQPPSTGAAPVEAVPAPTPSVPGYDAGR